MSVDDVKNIRSAYEKMLNDGRAFKKVNMPNVMTPDALGEDPKKALGEEGNKIVNEVKKNDEPDFSAVDKRMIARMNTLKNKVGSSDVNKEITALKQRVKSLEEALTLVMETQSKLLGD